MCSTQILVKRKLCSVTVCRECNAYALHIGPMSFRLEEDILAEVSEMFTDFSFNQKFIQKENLTISHKH